MEMMNIELGKLNEADPFSFGENAGVNFQAQQKSSS
jgi:hypothetical protein